MVLAGHCQNIICGRSLDQDDEYCGYCGCRVKPIKCENCSAPKKQKDHFYYTKCGKGYKRKADFLDPFLFLSSKQYKNPNW